MVPIKLQGNCLGERHKHFNSLVNQALGNTETRNLYKDVEEASDADGLFKIEMAIKCRDVDYILATLKSNDMLYVSRALKATWLITDNEYSHIINPQHLYTVLYPQMYNKAVCKLKLKIRQYLRSEKRCELFYNYYNNDLNDTKSSAEFLPYCSKDFILRKVNECDIFGNVRIDEVKDNIFKRIIERFPDVAEPVLKKMSLVSAQLMLSVLNCLAISQTDLYLHLLENYGGEYSNSPQLTKHLSLKIAKKYPQKLFDRLDIYLMRINLFSVAKVWQKKTIEEFLNVISKCEAYQIRRWFSEWTISGLLSKISEEDKQAIIKKYFPVNEIIELITENRDQYIYEMNYGNTYICRSKLHKWYERFPFDVAFPEIKQLIRASMSPDDRSTLLIELSVLAGEDQGHLKQVLHYYFIAHINEQKMHKIRFLDELVENKKVFLLEEDSWKCVNNLFISLETYGNENYSNYVEVIVLHDILNNQEVPESIMEKYTSNYHSKESLKKLSEGQRLQIFNYLISYFECKCKTMRAQEGITQPYCDLMHNFINIVNHWEKCVLNYPTIIYGITDIIKNKTLRASHSTHYVVDVVCFNLLNGLPIPDVVMEIYLKCGYSNDVPYISDENKAKTFDLLVTDFIKRTSYALDGHVDKLVINLTTSFIRFLYSSQKSLVDFPHLIRLMKNIVLAVPNGLTYPSEIIARRMLFDVSPLMSQSEDVLIDIIKHDATVLSRHFNNFKKLMIAEKCIYPRLLTKLRTYFDDSYASIFQNYYKTLLKDCEKPSTETKYVDYVNANLPFVFKKQAYSEVILEYLPKNHKVEWGDEDLSIINIRKHIAKNLHHVRPCLDMNIIYEFAQGDYLQYALPSLLSVCKTAPSLTFAEKILPKLLNSPVSVQKHGIRIAFIKLHLDQVSPKLQLLWSKTKNVSIRNTIFESTLILLTKQVKEDSMQVLWQLIKVFVSNLQEDEERTLLLFFYDHFNSLPKQVLCEACQICYRQMERIKDKINWDEIRNSLLHTMHLMLSEGMDLKFVGTILLEIFDKICANDDFANNSSQFRDLLVEYMLFGDEDQQSNNYENVARPIFDAITDNWNNCDKKKTVQTVFKYVLESLASSTRWKLEDGKQKTLVFNNIFDQLKTVCNIKEHFTYHIDMKLFIMLNDTLQETDFSMDIQEVMKRWAFLFSQKCQICLNDMVINYFPSIALSFRPVLHQFLSNIMSQWTPFYKGIFTLSFVDNMVREDSLPHNYLLGLYMYNHVTIVDPYEYYSTDYHSYVTSRILSIEKEEIRFHMATKLL